MFVLIFVTLAFVSFLLWFLLKGEADFTLIFKEKFGKPISALKGKVVWITGASSGIGESLAYVLAAENVKLVLSGTKIDNLLKVREKCLLSNKSLSEDDVLCLPFNMTDFNVHQEKFDTVIRHFGKLDILMNNAGRSQRASFLDIDLQVHKDLFDLNVFAPINLVKTVLPHFLENKSGQLILTSSTAGILGVPFSASYTGSKHAINGFYESFRTEFNRTGVKVTVVCPGPIVSHILENCYTGKVGEKFSGEPILKGKMSTERCAQLMAIAIANELDCCWISLQPVLILHYFAQYTPSFFRNKITKLTPVSYYKKIRDGKSD